MKDTICTKLTMVQDKARLSIDYISHLNSSCDSWTSTYDSIWKTTTMVMEWHRHRADRSAPHLDRMRITVVMNDDEIRDFTLTLYHLTPLDIEGSEAACHPDGSLTFNVSGKDVGSADRIYYDDSAIPPAGYVHGKEDEKNEADDRQDGDAYDKRGDDEDAGPEDFVFLEGESGSAMLKDAGVRAQAKLDEGYEKARNTLMQAADQPKNMWKKAIRKAVREFRESSEQAQKIFSFAISDISF